MRVLVGKVTSSGSTDAWAFITLLSAAVEAAIAFRTAGPVADRSSKSSNPRATAPASAPASAALCASVRATINMPTSTASIVALRNATSPVATMTRVMPRSSRSLL